VVKLRTRQNQLWGFHAQSKPDDDKDGFTNTRLSLPEARARVRQWLRHPEDRRELRRLVAERHGSTADPVDDEHLVQRVAAMLYDGTVQPSPTEATILESVPLAPREPTKRTQAERPPKRAYTAEIRIEPANRWRTSLRVE
jgi:hypothetical protein